MTKHSLLAALMLPLALLGEITVSAISDIPANMLADAGPSTGRLRIPCPGAGTPDGCNFDVGVAAQPEQPEQPAHAPPARALLRA